MTKQIPLIVDDPWLEPYQKEVQSRLNYLNDHIRAIRKKHKSLAQYAARHTELGLHWNSQERGWDYREWAPNAEGLALVGDFNNWDSQAHQLTPGKDGIWEIFVPEAEGLAHGTKFKVRVTAAGQTRDRLPAYTTYAVQDEHSYDFAASVWRPAKNFRWTDGKFLASVDELFIYECHTGMSTEREGVTSYREFADEVLPRIKKLGYNTIQLMAVQEHPYYGSFGYHVSNFFAPSSRFGTPDDLKYLVNTAHSGGIAVIMDLVHSHAVKNIAEGLNDFDGSGHQYFHEGGRGYHNSWDSKLFDYGKEEVERFLLSNIRYWLEEFHFDGFRFDGVTSMLYHHHGDFMAFDHYDKYFKESVDWDAVRYLQLANLVAREINPKVVTIAEDMSGMPGMSRTVNDGGIGFDYRLGMGIPDYWIKLLKHSRDEDWNIHEIWDVLNNRRYKEKTVAYAESHDQALVGDKTLAFWLMDEEMYWHMGKDDENIIIDRGMALHKMFRLLTAAVGGEAYLNFIGNEFGHPEWVDFPREGNNWSYKYARRQWHLVDNPDLKYQYLINFDQAMISCLSENHVLSALPAQQLNIDDDNKTIVFERNNLIFVFNFSPGNSIFDYKFGVPQPGQYQLILDSDASLFGGHGRIEATTHYFTQNENGRHTLSIYNTNRTGLVFKKMK